MKRMLCPPAPSCPKRLPAAHLTPAHHSLSPCACVQAELAQVQAELAEAHAHNAAMDDEIQGLHCRLREAKAKSS